MIDSSFLYICAFAFVAMFGGAMIGFFMARALPNHHLSASSASVVKLAAAVVATLTSMVLALMLSAANSAFSVNEGIVKKLSSDFVHLDHMLRTYGPEANEARAKLRAYAISKHEELFPAAGAPTTADRETADRLDALLSSVVSLSSVERRHNALGAQALTITANPISMPNDGCCGRIRAPPVPLPFLYVLIFWLFLIFVSFGLFAPVNATVVTSFFLCALAVTGAILMILELGDPMHHSWIQVSSEPMRRALIEIGRP